MARILYTVTYGFICVLWLQAMITLITRLVKFVRMVCMA